MDPPYPETTQRSGVMTISASPSSHETVTPLHALAQLRFPADLRLTPEQFALLCAENREAVLELAADGQVLAMTPTRSETGGRNIELAFQLQRYARSGTTWKAFDSSTGSVHRTTPCSAPRPPW